MGISHSDPPAGAEMEHDSWDTSKKTPFYSPGKKQRVLMAMDFHGASASLSEKPLNVLLASGQDVPANCAFIPRNTVQYLLAQSRPRHTVPGAYVPGNFHKSLTFK